MDAEETEPALLAALAFGFQHRRPQGFHNQPLLPSAHVGIRRTITNWEIPHVHVQPPPSGEAGHLLKSCPELIDLISGPTRSPAEAPRYSVILGRFGRMWIADMFSTHGELMGDERPARW